MKGVNTAAPFFSWAPPFPEIWLDIVNTCVCVLGGAKSPQHTEARECSLPPVDPHGSPTSSGTQSLTGLGVTN